MRGAKQESTYFLVCKESLIFFKVTVVAPTSGEMTKLRRAKNEGVAVTNGSKRKIGLPAFILPFQFQFQTRHLYGFEKFRNAARFGVIKRTRETRPSMQLHRTHTLHAMQTDTEPSEVACN